MKTSIGPEGIVNYELPVGDNSISLNDLLGRTICLEFLGRINCISCSSLTKKSFSAGYCYPCFMSLPETDMCVVKPEMCHFHKGTCRDEIWGKENCMIGHTVYLANSSNLKVGITRGVSPLKRWIDQGAIEAIPLGVTKNRLDSGTVELALKKHISDKTNWRKMLKGETEDVDLAEKREELVEYVPQDLDFLVSKLPTTRITYPVLQYPVKIRSLNFEKNPLVTGKLNGIKGQYLIFDNEVINIRKYAGYYVKFSA